MTFYREKLLEAVRALVDHGDLNRRLTHAAACLVQLDDDDVPTGALARFEGVRNPLIRNPIVAKGEMLPRDFKPSDARAAARAILDLLISEMSEAAP